jgi:hypothetical protein
MGKRMSGPWNSGPALWTIQNRNDDDLSLRADPAFRPGARRDGRNLLEVPRAAFTGEFGKQVVGVSADRTTAAPTVSTDYVRHEDVSFLITVKDFAKTVDDSLDQSAVNSHGPEQLATYVACG